MAAVEGSWSASEDVTVAGVLAGSRERYDQFFFEAQVDAHLRLWKHVSVAMGYRFHTIHFRQSTNLSGLNFHGPLVGLEIHF